MSDIHGKYKMFKQMIDKINFNAEDTLYIIGDMIDRGENSLSIISFAMRNDNVIALMGNHENFMINDETDLWVMNGGRITITQLENINGKDYSDVMSFVNNLPMYIDITVGDTDFKLVHAGVEINEDGSIKDKQDDDFMLWARNEYFMEPNPDITVISGHTPTFYIAGNDKKESSIARDGNKVFIDCGAAYGGRLACLRLDDMKDYYIGGDIL